ncbi:Phospholipase A2 domain-containing protein [Strongyloides ratti]|uniref:Phospholipase A2 domain-containing protein n=1 Tax=Strongyloides ratti TaxID=34506 RepID=A0A090MV53_STRRB|nr:Phospholipase A2 domain-containing protein [Strongyloides ratti]CEF62648.1 Phospholipase A2 domain-containing protein [Strongyloides ratti]
MIARICFYIFISLLGTACILVILTITNFPTLQQRYEHTGHWVCGNGENEQLSAVSASYRCPKAKENLNQCCKYHDECYHNQVGRHFCDLSFCKCLLANLEYSNSSNDNNCISTAKVYCNFVTVMGIFPYTDSMWYEEEGEKYKIIHQLSILSSIKNFFKSLFNNR